MPQRVANLGKVAIPVPIFNKDTEERTEIILQPGGKPLVPPGFEVDDVFAKRNANVLKIINT